MHKKHTHKHKYIHKYKYTKNTDIHINTKTQNSYTPIYIHTYEVRPLRL